MKTFSKKFDNWTCSDDERISITHIESKGKDLEDLMVNAEISFEDWNGNVVRENWTSGDLHSVDFNKLEKLFSEFLAGA